MRFPDKKFDAAGAYAQGYAAQIAAAMASINGEALGRATAVMREAIANDRLIFTCGNGGSAAIANHLVCDCGKGARADTGLRPRVFSLSSSIELITAIGNDISFEEIFAFQLQGMARPGDILITISSSGDSENIIRAISWAKANSMPVIAMSGFSGGRSVGLADISLYVAAQNYGVVEDVHQSMMHILAQYLRQSEMSAELVTARKF